MEQVIAEGKGLSHQVYPGGGNMFMALDTLFRPRRSKGRNETIRVPAKLSSAPSNGAVIHRVAVYKHATP